MYLMLHEASPCLKSPAQCSVEGFSFLASAAICISEKVGDGEPASG